MSILYMIWRYPKLVQSQLSCWFFHRDTAVLLWPTQPAQQTRSETDLSVSQFENPKSKVAETNRKHTTENQLGTCKP